MFIFDTFMSLKLGNNKHSHNSGFSSNVFSLFLYLFYYMIGKATVKVGYKLW